MAAATVNAAECFQDTERLWVTPALYSLVEEQAPYCIEIPFGQKFTVPTTSLDDNNDILRLMKFPAGAFITDLRCTPSDMDTNGTPALVYSLLAINDSDATQVTIVSGSTNGQAAAGSDRIATAAVGAYVGSYWLAFKATTAAATPAAGTLKIFLKFTMGIVNRGKSGRYTQNWEA